MTRSASNRKKMKQQFGRAHSAQNNNTVFSNVGSPAQATEPEKPSRGQSFSVGASLPTVEGDSTTPEAGKSIIVLGPSPGDALQKQTADTMGLFGTFGGSLHGAANIATTTSSGNGISSSSLTMLANSGATANCLDSDLRPDLKHWMTYYQEAGAAPRGRHDRKEHPGRRGNGHLQRHSHEQGMQPAACGACRYRGAGGLGRHLFSVTAAADTGTVTTFHAKPRPEMGGITLALQLDDDKVLYSFTLGLGNATTGTALMAKADFWHRLLAHVNARSLDVLRKVDRNVVN